MRLPRILRAAMARLTGPGGEGVSPAKLTRPLADPTVVQRLGMAFADPSREITAEELGHILRAAAEGYSDDYFALAEMMEERDLRYRGLLQTRRLAVSGLQWEVVADEREPTGEADADLVRGLVADGIDGLVYDLMDAVGKGLSMVGYRWETSENEWRPVGFTWSDPRNFTFRPPIANTELAPDGHSLWMRTEGMDSAEIPPYRFVRLFSRGKSGLPLRGGLARAAAWAFIYKNFSLTDWAAFLEIYGHPLRLGKYPFGAQDEDIEVLKRAVRDLGADSSAVVPEGMAIEFIQGVARGDSAIYKEMLQYLDDALSIAVLGHTAAAQSTQGRLGGEDNAESVRHDILADDAKGVAKAINRDLVRPLVAFNHGPRQHYPRIQPILPETEDLDQLSQQLERLAKVMPEAIPVDWVRSKWSIPAVEPGAPTLGHPQLPASPPPAAGDAAPVQTRHTGQRLPCGCSAHAQAVPQDEIERLTAAALGDWRPAVTPMVQAAERMIQEVIDEGGDLQALQQRIDELEERMDPSALGRRLAEESFTARVLGDANDEL